MMSERWELAPEWAPTAICPTCGHEVTRGPRLYEMLEQANVTLLEHGDRATVSCPACRQPYRIQLAVHYLLKTTPLP